MTGAVRFTEGDLVAFGEASGDRNPLHLSAAYAHRTSYGERVVFGCLGALAAIGHVRPVPGATLRSIALEFRNPLVLDVDYGVEVATTPAGDVRVSLVDAGRVLLRGTLRFDRGAEGDGSGPAAPPLPDVEVGPDAWRAEPADRALDDLAPGTTWSAGYGADAAALGRLLERLGVDPLVLDRRRAGVLCWASYLVGMEVPGRQAMFWRLDATFPGPPDDPAAPARTGFAYTATVTDVDRRVDVVTVEAELEVAGAALATATVRAFVRPTSPTSSTEAVAAVLPRSDALAGRTAVLTGGSRGLGAGIARALALSGATVLLGHRHGAEEAAAVRAGLGPGDGAVVLAPGDATAPAWAEAVGEQARRDHGGVDVVVCNASPSIGAMGLHPGSLERYLGFVQQSLALVAAPTSALVEDLAARGGWLVVLSSSALAAPPPEWPHYVTAKAAVEGLASWVAARHRALNVLVVRPPKLLTDQTNTPMGRRGAQSVEGVAAAIVRRLAGPPCAGGSPEVLDVDDLAALGTDRSVIETLRRPAGTFP